MDLKQLYDTLTPEQRAKFGGVKDENGFDAFLAETGIKITDEQSAAVREYFTVGRLPLSDEELENVGGGKSLSSGCHIFNGDVFPTLPI